MKRTPADSHPLPTGETFRYCSNCGHKAEAGADYCSHCGHLLRARESQDQSYRQLRSTGAITSIPPSGGTTRSGLRVLGITVIVVLLVIAAVSLIAYAGSKHDNSASNQNQTTSPQQQGSPSATTNNLEKFLPAQVGDFERINAGPLRAGDTEHIVAVYQRPNGHGVTVGLWAHSSKEKALVEAKVFADPNSVDNLRSGPDHPRQVQELSADKPAIYVEGPENKPTIEMQIGLLPSDKTVHFQVAGHGDSRTSNLQDIEDFMRSWGAAS